MEYSATSQGIRVRKINHARQYSHCFGLIWRHNQHQHHLPQKKKSHQLSNQHHTPEACKAQRSRASPCSTGTNRRKFVPRPFSFFPSPIWFSSLRWRWLQMVGCSTVSLGALCSPARPRVAVCSAHVSTPAGNLFFFSARTHRQTKGGKLGTKETLNDPHAS